MKSLVYHGAKDVRIDDKPKPQIKDREDIVMKVTSSAICGSDLHLYHGVTPGMEPGQNLGHEFMGGRQTRKYFKMLDFTTLIQ